MRVRKRNIALNIWSIWHFFFVSHFGFEYEDNQSFSNEGVYTNYSFPLFTLLFFSTFLIVVEEFFVLMFPTFSMCKIITTKFIPLIFYYMFHSFKCWFSSSDNFPKHQNRHYIFLKLFFFWCATYKVSGHKGFICIFVLY